MKSPKSSSSTPSRPPNSTCAQSGADATVSENEVRRLLGGESCFVLPCVQAKDGNVDALPTVLLEALASSCPTLTTRISGNPEIVEDGVSGLLVEPGNDRELAQAIRELALRRQWAESFGEAGRRRAEELFDIRRNVSVMREWLLDESSGACGNGRTNKMASAPIGATAAGEAS